MPVQVVVGKQQEETENAFVGGANRWRYDTFVNWEFWWPGFPVLVYFKVRRCFVRCARNARKGSMVHKRSASAGLTLHPGPAAGLRHA